MDVGAEDQEAGGINMLLKQLGDKLYAFKAGSRNN